ncbi:MAG TPA: FHA domain-containing protein [Vicinamibacteria bacterium]|jgi:DNA-binding winged helix-turn-helix (wHTH) protein|nr:FHA domain-containing protein [Vicinamibacteria bacterium]
MEIRFGECAIDTDARVLHRSGQPFHVSPRAFKLLEILLAARPRVVPKAELLKRLWPTTSVAEANLVNLIAEIRAALGDCPKEPRCVRTVHGYGYGFKAEVASEVPSADGEAFCWLVYNEGRVTLREGDHLVGRHPDSVVPIDSSSVSRKHARIGILGRRAILTDLGSRNGTFVSGGRVEGPVTLRDGDTIILGSLPLTFRVPALWDPTDDLDLTAARQLGRRRDDRNTPQKEVALECGKKRSVTGLLDPKH